MARVLALVFGEKFKGSNSHLRSKAGSTLVFCNSENTNFLPLEEQVPVETGIFFQNTYYTAKYWKVWLTVVLLSSII